jgi:hypothetical protein
VGLWIQVNQEGNIVDVSSPACHIKPAISSSPLLHRESR